MYIKLNIKKKKITRVHVDFDLSCVKHHVSIPRVDGRQCPAVTFMLLTPKMEDITTRGD